jgi:hypothetical protein
MTSFSTQRPDHAVHSRSLQYHQAAAAPVGQSCRDYCGAVTMPLPRSSRVTPAANTSLRARARRLLMTEFALGLTAPDDLSDSHQRAATPATCGHAMLVPLNVRKPPPFLTDRMSTPGAAIAAIVFENGAMSNFPSGPRPSAATAVTPSDAAGKDAAIVNGRTPALCRFHCRSRRQPRRCHETPPAP